VTTAAPPTSVSHAGRRRGSESRETEYGTNRNTSAAVGAWSFRVLALVSHGDPNSSE